MALNPIGPAPLPEKSEPGYIPVLADGNYGGKSNVTAFESKDGPSFSDVLDIINPLQHIPGVNTLYRNLTGDREGAVADLVGGTLYGGPIGLGMALVDLAVQDGTGKSIGDNVVAMFSNDKTATTAIAQAAPPQAGAQSGPVADSSEPPPPSASPLQVVSSAPLSAPKPISTAAATVSPSLGTASLGTDGPVRAGDFLMFGGAPASSGMPVALTPTPAPTPAPSPAPTKVATASPIAGPARQGGFMIFGGEAATSLPAAAPATPATPAAADTSDTPAPAVSAKNPAFMPLTAPRGPSTPKPLGMPTTGPGALPGGQSQAKRPGDQAAAGGDSWFSGAFNQGMDKYDRKRQPADGDAALLN